MRHPSNRMHLQIQQSSKSQNLQWPEPFPSAFDQSDAAHVNIADLAKKAHAIKDDAKHAVAVDAVRDAADALLTKWLASLHAKAI